MTSLVILGSDENELEEINKKLSKDGLRSDLSIEHKLRYMWRLYVRSENSLKSSVEDINKLRKQQADDMLQVESYISHIQQLSDEQSKFIEDYEKENDMLKDESKAIKDLLEQSELLMDAANMTTTTSQIQYLLNQQESLSESIGQLTIEKEILSETLSEHSSSFKEEHKLVTYLNQQFEIDEILEDAPPIQKIRILMGMVQKQRAEIESMKSEEEKLEKSFTNAIQEDGKFSAKLLIEAYESAEEKNVSMANEVAEIKKELQELTSVQESFSESTNCVDRLRIFSTTYQDQCEELNCLKNGRLLLQNIQSKNIDEDKIFETFAENYTLMRTEMANLQDELRNISSILQQSSVVAVEVDENASNLEKIKCLFHHLDKLKNNIKIQHAERIEIQNVFGLGGEDIVAGLVRMKSLWEAEIKSKENELQSYKQVILKDSGEGSMLQELTDIVENNKELTKKFDEVGELLVKVDIPMDGESGNTTNEKLKYLVQYHVKVEEELKTLSEEKENISNIILGRFRDVGVDEDKSLICNVEVLSKYVDKQQLSIEKNLSKSNSLQHIEELLKSLELSSKEEFVILPTVDKVQRLISILHQDSSELKQLKDDYYENCHVIEKDLSEPETDDFPSFVKLFKIYTDLKMSYEKLEQERESSLKLVQTITGKLQEDSLEENIKYFVGYTTERDESNQRFEEIDLLLKNNVSMHGENTDSLSMLGMIIREKNNFELTQTPMKKQTDEIVNIVNDINCLLQGNSTQIATELESVFKVLVDMRHDIVKYEEELSIKYNNNQIGILAGMKQISLLCTSQDEQLAKTLTILVETLGMFYDESSSQNYSELTCEKAASQTLDQTKQAFCGLRSLGKVDGIDENSNIEKAIQNLKSHNEQIQEDLTELNSVRTFLKKSQFFKSSNASAVSQIQSVTLDFERLLEDKHKMVEVFEKQTMNNNDNKEYSFETISQFYEDLRNTNMSLMQEKKDVVLLLHPLVSTEDDELIPSLQLLIVDYETLKKHQVVRAGFDEELNVILSSCASSRSIEGKPSIVNMVKHLVEDHQHLKQLLCDKEKEIESVEVVMSSAVGDLQSGVDEEEYLISLGGREERSVGGGGISSKMKTLSEQFKQTKLKSDEADKRQARLEKILLMGETEEDVALESMSLELNEDEVIKKVARLLLKNKTITKEHNEMQKNKTDILNNELQLNTEDSERKLKETMDEMNTRFTKEIEEKELNTIKLLEESKKSFRMDIINLKEELQRETNKSCELREKCNKLRHQIVQHENEIESKQVTMVEMTSMNGLLKTQLSDLKDSLKNSDTKINELMETLKEQTKKNKDAELMEEEKLRYIKLLGEVKMLRSKQINLEKENGVLQEQVQACKEEMEGLQIMLSSLEEDHSSAMEVLQEEHERTLNEELRSKDQEVVNLKNEIDLKEEQISQLKLQSVRWERSNEMLRLTNKSLSELEIKFRLIEKEKNEQESLLQFHKKEKVKMKKKIEELQENLLTMKGDLEKTKMTLETAKSKLKKKKQELKMREDTALNYRTQISHLHETNDIQNDLLEEMKKELHELQTEHGEVLHQSQTFRKIADKETGRTKDVTTKVTKVKSQNSDLRNTLKAAIEELNHL